MLLSPVFFNDAFQTYLYSRQCSRLQAIYLSSQKKDLNPFCDVDTKNVIRLRKIDDKKGNDKGSQISKFISKDYER